MTMENYALIQKGGRKSQEFKTLSAVIYICADCHMLQEADFFSCSWLPSCLPKYVEICISTLSFLPFCTQNDSEIQQFLVDFATTGNFTGPAII